MTVSRSALEAAAAVTAASSAESVRCLSSDDCFDYLDGRATREDIDGWRQHIDVCDACRIVVAEAARSALISSPSGSERAPRTLAEGEIVANRYRIVRFVARGGMGEVYEAFDSILQQRLALKTLVLTAIDQEEAVMRFLEEVRIARKVVHPHVCQIWEVGIHRWSSPREGAVPFLTMDYLVGETLAQCLVRIGRLPPVNAVSLFRELSAGLAAVHAAGIVHRDLKSDNVFLVADDTGADRVVVMDFGLARTLEHPHAGFVSSGTRLLGTPAYMAPEQVEGGEVTRAADIYALGIVMFEALTGRIPFSGETAASIALSRLRQEAPRPSAFVPDLDPAWDTLLSRCLARDPRARFADAGAVGAALQALSLSRGKRRRTASIWAAIATLSVLLAGLATLVGGARGQNHAPAAPTRPPPARPSSPIAPAAPTALPPATALNPGLAVTTTASAAASRRERFTAPAPSSRSAKRAKQPRAKPATDAGPLVDIGEELLADGRIAEACAVGQRAVAQNEASANAQAFLGRCYMRLGSPRRARESYARYLELEPSAPNAEFVRAIIRAERQ
jgi:tRNA A-37 threonylcarbamoyl transferase component Bud32